MTRSPEGENLHYLCLEVLPEKKVQTQPELQRSPRNQPEGAHVIIRGSPPGDQHQRPRPVAIRSHAMSSCGSTSLTPSSCQNARTLFRSPLDKELQSPLGPQRNMSLR